MIHGILAHAGGWDEMAIILFPIVVGGGVWLLTRGSGPQAKKPSVRPREPTSKPPRFGPADPKSKPPGFS